MRKRLFDPASGEWVPTLDAQVGFDGNLVRDVYTYRVEFLPHGSYNNVVISDVDDVLASGVEFIGFVEPEDALEAANPVAGPVTLKGNIEAVYAGGVVKLKQIDGTKLKADEPIAAYFAVKVNDSSAPIVNKIGGTEAVITPVATFNIAKTITGPQEANSEVPGTVNVTASWEENGEPASQVLTVPTDGSALPFGKDLPLGTVVTLTEATLVDGNGIAWGTPTWTDAGVTAESDGSVTIVIGKADEKGVQLENKAGTSVGGVTIEKKLEGGAKGLVTLTDYEVTAKIDTTALGDEAGTYPDRVVTVKVDVPVQLDNLPVGATVTFSEAKLVDTDQLTWAAPVISPESIEITEDHLQAPAAITVTNSVERTVGTFDIKKLVTGAESGSPAVPATVDVTATWGDESKILTVPTDGTPVPLGEKLLIGTQVTLSETPLVDGDGIAWAAPGWSGSGVTLADDGNATVTVGRDADARVTLENHAATSTAGINLIKQLGGAAAGEVDAETEFTVRASWDLGDGEQHTDLKINAVTPTPLDEELPAGTIVTLTELERPEIAGVEWGAVVFAGDRVTPGAEDSAQFVVSTQQGAVDLLTVSNEANWAPGTFSLAKQITDVPLDHPDVPAAVTVRATWNDGEAEQSKDIQFPADGTKVPFGESLPYETKVVLTEVEAGSSTSFTWATPAWSEERVTSNEAGVAELTIGAALDTEITLTNAAVATAGSLSITKSLSGEGAVEVPAGTEFPVTASWTDLQGEQQKRDITVTAGVPTVIDGVAFGTKVTLSEGARPDTGEVKWFVATCSTLSEAVGISADGTEAVITVTGSAGDSIALSLDNEYEASPSDVDSGGGEGDSNGSNGDQGGSGLSVTGSAGLGLLAVLGLALLGIGALLFMRRRNA